MSDEDQAGVVELIASLRELRDVWELDSIAVVADTALGKVRLTLTVGAPLVIEDMLGNSLVGEYKRQ